MEGARHGGEGHGAHEYRHAFIETKPKQEDKTMNSVKKSRRKRKEEEKVFTDVLGELSHLLLMHFLSFNELRGKILRYQVLH